MVSAFLATRLVSERMAASVVVMQDEFQRAWIGECGVYVPALVSSRGRPWKSAVIE